MAPSPHFPPCRAADHVVPDTQTLSPRLLRHAELLTLLSSHAEPLIMQFLTSTTPVELCQLLGMCMAGLVQRTAHMKPLLATSPEALLALQRVAARMEPSAAPAGRGSVGPLGDTCDMCKVGGGCGVVGGGLEWVLPCRCSCKGASCWGDWMPGSSATPWSPPCNHGKPLPMQMAVIEAHSLISNPSVQADLVNYTKVRVMPRPHCLPLSLASSTPCSFAAVVPELSCMQAVL